MPFRYRDGTGVKKDFSRAMYYLGEAQHLGASPAEMNLMMLQVQVNEVRRRIVSFTKILNKNSRIP